MPGRPQAHETKEQEVAEGQTHEVAKTHVRDAEVKEKDGQDQAEETRRCEQDAQDRSGIAAPLDRAFETGENAVACLQKTPLPNGSLTPEPRLDRRDSTRPWPSSIFDYLHEIQEGKSRMASPTGLEPGVFGL